MARRAAGSTLLDARIALPAGIFTETPPTYDRFRAMSRHTHDHDHRSTSQSALLIALAFTTFFAVVEAIAGWWSNSLALIGDAGHMITDSVALGLGALAARMSRRPPSLRHSYGLKRAEVVGAMCNIALMLVVLVYIAFEAFTRLKRSHA